MNNLTLPTSSQFKRSSNDQMLPPIESHKKRDYKLRAQFHLLRRFSKAFASGVITPSLGWQARFSRPGNRRADDLFTAFLPSHVTSVREHLGVGGGSIRLHN
jgi:hypothetical protein